MADHSAWSHRAGTGIQALLSQTPLQRDLNSKISSLLLQTHIEGLLRSMPAGCYVYLLST